MGVDQDFVKYLNRNKLTESMYQQPINETDGLTQSTEAPNFENLIQILNLLQTRLGQSQSPFVIMVSLGDNRRFLISFGNNNAQRNNNQNTNANRLFNRQQRIGLNQRNQQENLMNEPRGMRIPELPRLPSIPRMPRFTDHIGLHSNNQGELQQQTQEQRVYNRQMNGRFEFDVQNEMQQERIRDQNQIQRRDQRDNQENTVQINNLIEEERPSRLFNEDIQNNKENMASNQDQTLNSIYPLSDYRNPGLKIKERKEQVVQPQLTCWQSVKRTIRNIFVRAR